MAHLLIVEDDPAVTSLLEDVLGSSGYSITSTSRGEDALAEMRQHLPDLIVLDLMLPDMNGWTFLHVREGDLELASVPVLVISATGPAGAAQAQAAGAPIFLAKPFDIEVLRAEVERLCNGSVRQCAWCRRVMDARGEFRVPSVRKLRWATHGICPACKDRERRDLLN